MVGAQLVVYTFNEEEDLVLLDGEFFICIWLRFVVISGLEEGEVCFWIVGHVGGSVKFGAGRDLIFRFDPPPSVFALSRYAILSPRPQRRGSSITVAVTWDPSVTLPCRQRTVLYM